MDKYYITPIKLYDLLKAKGVTSFFHANTVKTAKSFITNNALLSRGCLEKNKIDMTPQISDDKDKEFGVWNDIFLDGKDLSELYSRPNNYGPITFVMSLELLKSDDIGDILITRNNPMYWKSNYTNEQKYLLNIDEVKELYLAGHYSSFGRIMFTFKNADNKIKLSEFCEKIIIDKTVNNYFNENLITNLCKLRDDANLSHIPIIPRNRFIYNYNNMHRNILTMKFMP